MSIDTLIISDSWDTTSDLVINKIGPRAFRLNSDIIRDYIIDLSETGFSILSPSGLKIKSPEIRNVYWRKPFSSEGYNDSDHPEAYFYAETRYLIRELYNICKSNGAHCLVEEGAERRLGKVRQLLIASQYFRVPEWRVSLGIELEADKNTVVKSLSGEPLRPESVLYTSRVDYERLDEKYLWFSQAAVSKIADLTVVFVQGSIFCFRLEARDGSVDWRENIPSMEASDWIRYPLTQDTMEAISSFMSDCGLQFGRLDFVVDKTELFFLEVNPNGQWAWLDLKDQQGLLSSVAKAVCNVQS